MTPREIAVRARGRCTQNEDELERLCEKVQALRPRVGLEIGVHGGGSLEAWALCAAEDALLIGVDIDTLRARVSVAEGQLVFLVEGDSSQESTRLRVERLLDGKEVDFLFIDGGHEVEDVRGDYALYSPLVRDGGLIAFHDVLVCSGPAAVWETIPPPKELLEGCGPGTAFGTGVIYK